MEQLVEKIVSFDKQLLLSINHWTAPWADRLMSTMSSVTVWFPLYILVAIAIFIPKVYSGRSLYCRECSGAKMWKAGLTALAAVLVCYLLTDHVSDIVRNAVCRPRPGHDPEIGNQVRLINGAGSPYGFFSGHAANTVGFAAITSLILRRRVWTAVSLIWALLVCYSRCYLGQHYPLDVLTGILCGAAFAAACYLIYRFVMRKINLRADSASRGPS